MRYALGLGALLLLAGCSSGEETTETPAEEDSGAVDSTAKDSGTLDTGAADSGAVDSGDVDSGAVDSSMADTAVDSGVDSGTDTGVDSGTDTGVDTGTDTGVDTGVDTGTDSDSDTMDAAGDSGPPVLGCGANKWRVFTTSAMYSGNLGGLVGADAKCQVRANAASLGGAWKAWLSDSSASPSTRFNKSTTPYFRVDGTQVAASYTALTSGTLAAPIIKDETGANVVGEVWTGTTTGGTADPGCNNFTATTGSTPPVGISDRTNSTWTGVYDQFCDRTNVRLYCFEQCPTTGVSDPGTGAATTGDKTVFVSSAMYTGDLGGLVGADAKCQTLANAAGLTGTYKAFLGDSAKSASARMSKSTGAYKLKNGTTVAANATAFFSGTHAAAIDRDENGTAITSTREVWTGTDGAGTETGSCSGWTSASATETVKVGHNTVADATWAYKYLQYCNRANVSLYCVQQ